MGRSPGGRRPNHLQGQTSPYLEQHLYNPVDWYPWGPEALERARREDRPIFLSIGYAACHWCHVMERESFEDPRTAEILNARFVPIKVDREERPDIDEIYMNAVQLLTGQGGWPMSLFLTPELEPFAGGTYFPPEDRYGHIGFRTLLERVHAAWTAHRADVTRTAVELTAQLRRIAAGAVDAAVTHDIDVAELTRAAAELSGRFDARWGGFGGAPKFPADGALGLLLRQHTRSGEPAPLGMVETTLDRMALGGMYDHIGGGFARYSVDERWLVPHFEKMLYNQALLVPLYLDAWLLLRKPLYRRVVEQTLDFVRRELADPDGGFHSSLDADSGGVEGGFYVWTPEQVDAALGPADGALFAEIYDVGPRGNFEGGSIANLLGGSLAERAAARGLDEAALAARLTPLWSRLLEVRERRERPATDDKVVTAWNGLMITAFARAYQVLGRATDLRSATAAADFAEARLMREGRLLATYRGGVAQLNGYLDDYAFLARGLVDLYEASFEPRFLSRAAALARTVLERFEDPTAGGFFFTSDDHETLLARSRSMHDGALPAGAGVAAEVLLRLGLHLDEPRFRAAAERTLAAYHPAVTRMPSAYAAVLVAADLARGPVHEVAIVGTPGADDTRALLAVVRDGYRPRLAIQIGLPDESPQAHALLRGKGWSGNAATAYVCRNSVCGLPASDAEELRRQLAGVSAPDRPTEGSRGAAD